MQELRLKEQFEAIRRLLGQDDFIEFVADTLLRYNFEALTILDNGLEGIGVYIKIELCGKANGAHHAQRVIGEGNIRAERRANQFAAQVVLPAEGVYQFPIVFLIERDGQGIDGEVAAILVVFQRTIFYDGFAGVALVRLFARTHKLQLPALPLEHGRAKIFEKSYFCTRLKALRTLFGQGNAAAQAYKVNVFGRALEQQVSHIATHYIHRYLQGLGGSGYLCEYRRLV